MENKSCIDLDATEIIPNLWVGNYKSGLSRKFIKDNNIGIGTTIELIRSGDVIPHILSVTVPAQAPKMPSQSYKWNSIT